MHAPTVSQLKHMYVELAQQRRVPVAVPVAHMPDAHSVPSKQDPPPGKLAVHVPLAPKRYPLAHAVQVPSPVHAAQLTLVPTAQQLVAHTYMLGLRGGGQG